MKIKKPSLKDLPRYGLFVPSVTWNVIPSEIFPYGIIYALLNLKFARTILIVIMAGLISGVLPILFNQQFIPQQFLISIIAFVNSTAVLLVAASPFQAERFQSVMKTFLIIVMGVCAIQWIGVLAAYSEWFQLLVPRGKLEALSAVRGVTGLSSEPSRSGYEFLTLLYAFFVGEYLRAGKKYYWFMLFALFATIFLYFNRSLTALAISLLYFGVLYCTVLKSRVQIKLAFAGLLFLSLLVFAGDHLLFSERLQNLVDYKNMSDLWDNVVTESFHRVPVIWYSLLYLYEHPFGAGFGNFEFAQALYQHTDELYLNRLPWGMQLLLDTGIFYSFFVLCIAVYACVKAHLLRFIWPMIVIIVCLSDPGNTIPFVAICYIFCMKQHRNRLDNDASTQ